MGTKEIGRKMVPLDPKKRRKKENKCHFSMGRAASGSDSALCCGRRRSHPPIRTAATTAVLVFSVKILSAKELKNEHIQDYR